MTVCVSEFNQKKMVGRVLIVLFAIMTIQQAFGCEYIWPRSLIISNLNISLLYWSVIKTGFQLLSTSESWILVTETSQQWTALGKSISLSLLALSRSSSGSWNASSIEGQLAIKQVDIDFLYDRVRQGDAEIYSDRLISLAVTLTSLCRHPANYYDYDLLGTNIQITFLLLTFLIFITN